MYRYEIWDKKSAINGVEAKNVLEIHNIESGEVGLVLDELGNVVVLQYDNSAPLSKEDLLITLEKITGEMNNPPIEESEIIDSEIIDSEIVNEATE